MKKKYTTAQEARRHKARLRRELAALVGFAQLNARKILAGKHYSIAVTVFDSRGQGLGALMVKSPPPPPPPLRFLNRSGR